MRYYNIQTLFSQVKNFLSQITGKNMMHFMRNCFGFLLISASVIAIPDVSTVSRLTSEIT